VLRQQVLHPIGTEGASPSVREQRIRWLALTLAKPGTQHLHGLFPQRRAAFLPTFALATDVCAVIQHHVFTTQANQLRQPQSRFHRHPQQDGVASASPRLLIGCLEQRFHLHVRQIVDRPARVPLAGDSQNALRLRHVFGFLQGHVAEEGMNRCQPSVAAACAIAPCVLQVIEKGDQEGHIDLSQSELRGLFLQTLLGKLQEQAERVAVTGDRMRTDTSLPNQSIREEPLEQPGKGGLSLHDSLLSAPDAR